MRARLWIVVGVAAGCQKLLDLEVVTVPDASVVTGDGGPTCTPNPALFQDNFDVRTGSACSAWGATYAIGSAGAGFGNDRLVVNVYDSGVASYAGCLSNFPLPIGELGVFVAIEERTLTSTGWTLLGIEEPSGKGAEIVTFAKGTGLQLSDLTGNPNWGQTVFDPAKTKFVRMRADQALGAYVAEYSPDAVSWKKLGDTVGKLAVGSAGAQVFIEGGDNVGSAGTSAFSHLNVCP